MVDMTGSELPVSLQAELFSVNRTSLYYRPKSPDSRDLEIKEAIDKIYTCHPEFGYRRIGRWLKKHEGMAVNHKSVLRHMREMGIQAIYPKPDTSKPNPANKIYPYLLTGLDIASPNQVWSIDITYIPVRRSWLYLTVILDWYSRYVVAWAIDDTLEMDFVLEVCDKALNTGVPIIMNSDQGSHFTSPKYTGLFLEAGAKISMDHRGRAFDNIFIERLWRTVKYEDVYLRHYDRPRDARIGIARFMDYYNNERIHQSLDYLTPAEVYCRKQG